jgi:hypothetical protein
VVISNGTVTTIAGPAQGCYSTCVSSDINGVGNAANFGPITGITMDGAKLYIPDFGFNKIRQVDIATASVITPAGPAQGTSTSGDTDSSGNAARFQAPYSATTDGISLYVTDGNNKIRKIQ